ncbi:hypothetical protein GYMLUDRAFT_62305 [Collybiopsis luxurians FD-317 M1]|uniref:Uncharacterized protein n=1 Tax=Collybiopsis luxurians FD-317 M1 TaxID=944289 RepID=A0A0D0BM02_9AGAR|nr:hypothetical protein GYMLUDRAFT_62305 [Collybiopsis luxurians FD-317 M1]
MDKTETVLWRQAHSREYCMETDTPPDVDSALVEQELKTSIDPLNTENNTPSGDRIHGKDEITPTIDHDMEIHGEEVDSESEGFLSSSPAPSDPAHVLCRCGVESDGH